MSENPIFQHLLHLNHQQSLLHSRTRIPFAAAGKIGSLVKRHRRDSALLTRVVYAANHLPHSEAVCNLIIPSPFAHLLQHSTSIFLA
jgi:hypothetical protein